jgi:cellulose synthase/poly-beta-1,6-N-acetylglucosamine synthase-like glycosyltransferase
MFSNGKRYRRRSGAELAEDVRIRSTRDGTQEVVERHIRVGAVPGLRMVDERTQGLTPARRHGVHDTSGPWLAFVDDDCLLPPDWIKHTGLPHAE